MKIANLGRWQIKHDSATTAESYSVLPVGNGCTCDGCQNFMAALDHAFPREFRALADLLGIDICKPVEITHYGRGESGLHFMGGWFHFIGEILTGADGFKTISETSWEPDFEPLTEAFSFGLTSRIALVSEPFKAHNLVQLEFHTHIPWVIAAQEYD